jgi:hypothetical protein
MFETLILKKQGRDIKDYATRKRGLLQTRIDQVKESIQDIDKHPTMTIEQKKLTNETNLAMLDTMTDTIEFLTIIYEHLPADETFDLTARELNFLLNSEIYSYG